VIRLISGEIDEGELVHRESVKQNNETSQKHFHCITSVPNTTHSNIKNDNRNKSRFYI